MLVVDTGVLLAAADRSDPDHDRCAQVLQDTQGPLVTTGLVVAETAYLIQRQLGPTAESGFFRALANGQIQIEPLSAVDLEQIADLVAQYEDLPLGGTDASLIAIAERLDQTQIATIDHRHFAVVRPKHAQAFSLVP